MIHPASSLHITTRSKGRKLEPKKSSSNATFRWGGGYGVCQRAWLSFWDRCPDGDVGNSSHEPQCLRLCLRWDHNERIILPDNYMMALEMQSSGIQLLASGIGRAVVRSRGLPNTFVRKVLLASDPSSHSPALPRAWVSAYTRRSLGLQANPLTRSNVWEDRCAQVTSRNAAKVSPGPLQGSRRSGTARLFDTIGKIDAVICHWVGRFFFENKKQFGIVMWLTYCRPLSIEHNDVWRGEINHVAATTASFHEQSWPDLSCTTNGISICI